MELASLVFGQAGVAWLAPLEWIMNVMGLGVLLILLGTYFKKGQDASFWKSDTAKTIYLMAVAIGVTQINVEAYTQALGAFGAIMANLLAIILKFAGTVAVQPVLISGVIVLGVEILNDLYEYAKEGKLFKKFPKLD